MQDRKYDEDTNDNIADEQRDDGSIPEVDTVTSRYIQLPIRLPLRVDNNTPFMPYIPLKEH
jgi:hypothetical protein